jgi:TldD protein
MSEKEIGSWGVDTAIAKGATYCDVRIVDDRQRMLMVKNGKVAHASDSESRGVGIRVIAAGAWGFSSTDNMSRESVERTAAEAVAIARASAKVQDLELRLAPEKSAQVEWSSPCEIDPFAMPLEEHLDFLFGIDKTLRSVEGITLAEANLNFRRYEQWFYSSEGAAIHQTRHVTGGGFDVYSFAGSEIQKRSYPNSFGGQYQNRGYELVQELDLPGNAKRIAQECVALHQADPCPQGRMDLVLDSSQLGLQIHESIGHPIELDRVLGMEANFAGTSFLTLDKLRTLRYGSDLVNVVADATEAHGPGLGTFAYDDEGVEAQSTKIITNGMFTGYLTSRETATMVGDARSNGTMRAEGWHRIPIIRMTNVSILPGEKPLSFDQLISTTDDGIFMQTNRSWSIDDKRYNFQFGCEAAWEIKGGKLGRMFKNPSYSGITTEFWNSMDAICSREHWRLWGTPNCGKAQPTQTMGTGHGASPARFRQVKVGSAFKGN